MLYIGIDIHKHSHEICILDQVGKPCGQPFQIANSHPRAAELLERIQRVNREQQPLRFGMEATGHYWMSLLIGLLGEAVEDRLRSVHLACHDCRKCLV